MSEKLFLASIRPWIQANHYQPLWSNGYLVGPVNSKVPGSSPGKGNFSDNQNSGDAQALMYTMMLYTPIT